MAQPLASVQVLGLRELQITLERLPAAVAGPILHDALTAAGEVIKRAAAGNIHSKSGRTAADIRVEVQTQPAKAQGAAAVGGTVKGTTGRAHVLRWLEFGTKPHTIVAGAQDRRDARKAARALRRLGDTAAASALRRGVREGTIGVRRALTLPGGVFRAAVKHPGTRNQSPLTRALAEQGDRAIAVFREKVWAGLQTVAAPLVRRVF